jgi:dienelactone hydrolase
MMNAAVTPPLPLATAQESTWHARPPWRRMVVVTVALAILVASSALGSTFVNLNLPAPTGEHAVGKAVTVIEDPRRGEPATADTTDQRAVRLVAWYPAQAGTGEPAAYLEGLEQIGDGLVASGSIGELERMGLGFVTTSARRNADVATASGRHPIAILSPGNATNVEFYGALAEELASHGYVVIGVDHPFQSAAVAIRDTVAVYAGDAPMSEAAAVTSARIDERVADISFVLDRLATDAAGIDPLRDRLDLERVAVIGHSNGGLAAVQVCDDPRVHACANIDGQNMAGPFGIGTDPAAPANPFMFLTKETELHPTLAEAFEDGGTGAFRVVVPAAEHDSFTDGPRFRPRLLPVAGTTDAVTTITRGFTLAFLNHTLRGAPRTVFGEVDAPTDVFVSVYPLIRADQQSNTNQHNSLRSR